MVHWLDVVLWHAHQREEGAGERDLRTRDAGAGKALCEQYCLSMPTVRTPVPASCSPGRNAGFDSVRPLLASVIYCG